MGGRDGHIYYGWERSVLTWMGEKGMFSMGGEKVIFNMGGREEHI